MKKLLIFLALFTSCAAPNSMLNEQDYFDKVLTLPDNVYESISLSCGDGSTYGELWNEYESNRAFYDSLEYAEVYINQ